MATIITEECIACGACEDECPTGAIRLGDRVFVIDPGRCTECVGFSAVRMCDAACPVACCVPDPERVESEATLFARALATTRRGGPEPVLGAETSHFRGERCATA